MVNTLCVEVVKTKEIIKINHEKILWALIFTVELLFVDID